MSGAATASPAPYHCSQGTRPSNYTSPSTNHPSVHSITPSFAVLFKHFFAVAFYSIWVMFTQPQPVLGLDEKITYLVPGWEVYPYLLLKSLYVVRVPPFPPPPLPSCLRSMLHADLTPSRPTVLDGLHRVRPAHVGRDAVVVSERASAREN